MKINAQTLRDALKLVAPAIPKNSLYPILEGVKIEEGFLHASNSELSVCVPLAFELPPMVLEYTTLKAAVEKLDSDELELIQKDNTGITLKSGRARVTVPSVGAANEWPKIAADKTAPVCELTREQVFQAMGLIPFTIQNDISRPSMAGIAFDGVEFAATTGHILGVYKVHAGEFKRIILPVKLFYVLAGFSNADTFVFDKGTVSVKRAGEELAVVRFRTIDERYPEYQHILPNYSTFPKASFEREEMADAIEVLTIGANTTTNTAAFEFGKAGGIVASAQDIDRNRDAAVNITSVNTRFDEPMKIGFNTKFLFTVLKFLGGEETTLHANAPSRAAVLTTEDTSKLALVMPVMLL